MVMLPLKYLRHSAVRCTHEYNNFIFSSQIPWDWDFKYFFSILKSVIMVGFILYMLIIYPGGSHDSGRFMTLVRVSMTNLSFLLL